MLGVMPNLDALVTTTLDNGLDVIVDSDLTLPAVAINLWYNVGSADERPGRDGFAHLFEHLMFSGTTSGIASGEHLATIEAVGGSANATTSFDRTNYFELVPPGALELGLWLEAERETRRRRALERDGETFVPYWLAWELQEDAWFAAHPPRPDALVPVPDDPIRG